MSRKVSGENNPNWKGGRTASILVRLTPELKARITKIAKVLGCSVSDAINSAIEIYCEDAFEDDLPV